MPNKPDETTESHIGEKLAEAMQAKGVDIATVAAEFGVKKPSVYDWLKFGRIANKHFPHLVDYFERPYEWWFGAVRLKTTEGLSAAALAFAQRWEALPDDIRGRVIWALEMAELEAGQRRNLSEKSA